ncbi:hypothetical protein FB107DRAFT_259153 [Schizophyllum commune]
MNTRMAGSSDLSRYKRKECTVRGSFTADWDMAASTRQVRKARRSSKKDLDFTGSLTRELDFKRSKGEISCAECRRLKIKCSKTRRGCAPLCPNGSLATGQGTRFVFEATEHLHQHVAQLKRRIQSLEQALASLQQERSSDPHPLLAEATDLDCGDADAGDPSPDLANMEDLHDKEALPMDLVGTLVVADEGVTRFYGPTGGSESLLMLRAPSVGGETLFAPSVSPLSFPSPIDSTSLPSSPATSIISASTLNEWSTSCLAGFPADAAFGDPLSHLPLADEAMALVDIYFSTAGWLLSAITREQIEDDMLPAVYGFQASCSFDDGTPPQDIDYRSPHAIAVLFAIFAVASAVKNASASGSSPSSGGQRTYAEMNGARRYHELAHACLSLRPVLQRPSVFTIQALYLMSAYDGIAGGCEDLFKDSPEGSSAVELGRNLLSLAVHLSLTINRNARRWAIPAKDVRRREILFWHLFTADVWQSLHTGRPPLFSLLYVDCNMPEYADTNQHASERWHFIFAAKCVSEVVAATVTAAVPSFATIMALDRKVRNFPSPDCDASRPSMISYYKETALLYLHRSFFARATVLHPDNPLRSPYSHSFLTVCRASSAILKSVKDQYIASSPSSIGHWSMWTDAFAAAVVHATVVIHAPFSPIVATSKEELEQACVLFARAAPSSARASQALLVLKSLAAKADAIHSQAYGDDRTGDEAVEGDAAQDAHHLDELSIFAGCAHFHSFRIQPIRSPLMSDTAAVSASGEGESPVPRDVVMSGAGRTCGQLALDVSALSPSEHSFPLSQQPPLYAAPAPQPAQPPSCHALWTQEAEDPAYFSRAAGMPNPAVTAWPGVSAAAVPFSYPPPEYTSTDEGQYAPTQPPFIAAETICDLTPFDYSFAAPTASIAAYSSLYPGASHSMYTQQEHLMRHSHLQDFSLIVSPSLKLVPGDTAGRSSQLQSQWEDVLV